MLILRLLVFALLTIHLASGFWPFSESSDEENGKICVLSSRIHVIRMSSVGVLIQTELYNMNCFHADTLIVNESELILTSIQRRTPNLVVLVLEIFLPLWDLDLYGLRIDHRNSIAEWAFCLN